MNLKEIKRLRNILKMKHLKVIFQLVWDKCSDSLYKKDYFNLFQTFNNRHYK